MLAHWVSAFSGWSVEEALKVLNPTVWLSIGPIVGRYLWSKGVAFSRAAVVATVPYPALAATHYLIPDSLSVALLLLLILGLEMGQTVVPVIAGVLQMLARNTSLLTIFLWLAVRRRTTGWVRIGAVLAAAVAGLLLLALIRPVHADNEHQLNPLAYLLLKTPVNYFRNLFSMEFVFNNKDVFCTPVIYFDISKALHGKHKTTRHLQAAIRPDGPRRPNVIVCARRIPFVALADIWRRRRRPGATLAANAAIMPRNGFSFFSSC
jgi:hypothetical protein